MENDKHYKTLIEYLKALRREGTTITNWIPEYEIRDGKETGRITITIDAQEKK